MIYLYALYSYAMIATARAPSLATSGRRHGLHHTPPVGEDDTRTSHHRCHTNPQVPRSASPCHHLAVVWNAAAFCIKSRRDRRPEPEPGVRLTSPECSAAPSALPSGVPSTLTTLRFRDGVPKQVGESSTAPGSSGSPLPSPTSEASHIRGGGRLGLFRCGLSQSLCSLLSLRHDTRLSLSLACTVVGVSESIGYPSAGLTFNSA